MISLNQMKKLTKNESIGVAAALVVVGFLIFGAQFWSLFTGSNASTGDASANATAMNIPTTGVQIEDQVVGTGPAANAGDTVTVNYVGMLTDGKVFDSSYDRNQPIVFKLGAGQVIKGWDSGLQGMKVGGKRRLVIAPDAGYGNQNVGPIPANSTLVFDVELVSIGQ